MFIIFNNAEVTGKVQAISKIQRTITLMGPDGKTKEFKVDKSVKRFNEIQKGENITLRVTQALAINVVKP